MVNKNSDQNFQQIRWFTSIVNRTFLLENVGAPRNKNVFRQMIVMILNILLICAINQIPLKKIVYFFNYFDQIHIMLTAQYMNAENR